MSLIPNEAPITCLDTDILWYIIKINADMFNNDSALETTLATSHVCRAWRLFMLSMNSIWAHLIDLDHFHGRTEEWMCEIFRRSGTAFLWIKAYGTCALHCPGNEPSCCTMYALNILATYWGRIQRLGVTFNPQYVDYAQWSPLYFTPPHLESLILNLQLQTHNYEFPPFLPLLRGNAPMLRDFTYRGHGVKLTAPWLCQLHSMELSVHLTISETLAVLLLTPNLVNLRIDQTIMGDTTPTLPLPDVDLPKLAHLALKILVQLNPSNTLLDYIHVPPSCALNFSTEMLDPTGYISKATLKHIMRVISTYARHHFAYHVPKTLSLRYSLDDFAIDAGLRSAKPTFTFGMKLSSTQLFPPFALSILLDEFTLPNFSNVMEFEFIFSAIDYSFPELTAFTTCLSSTDTIKTDGQALRLLIRVQESLKAADTGSQIVFPALKVLKLHVSRFHFVSDISNALSDFLAERVAHGHTIDLLDLTWRTVHGIPDMQFLKEPGDYKVLWRQSRTAATFEYIRLTNTFQIIGSI